MSNKDENKSRKRLTLSVILVVSLGILSIAYAVLTSRLNINSSDSKLTSKYQGVVQFDAEKSFDYSVGTTDDNLSSSLSNLGPFYSQKSGKSTTYDLTSGSSPSYVFAKAGTVDISRGTSENDTATIDGTELFDKGSYVVYKLQVKNISNLPMRFSGYNNNSLINNISSDTESLKDIIKDIVEVKIYTGDPTSAGAEELKELSAESAKSVTDNQPNCLQPNGTADWFVRVYCKKEATSFATGTFKFNVQPTWMPVQK